MAWWINSSVGLPTGGSTSRETVGEAYKRLVAWYNTPYISPFRFCHIKEILQAKENKDEH